LRPAVHLELAIDGTDPLPLSRSSARQSFDSSLTARLKAQPQVDYRIRPDQLDSAVESPSAISAGFATSMSAIGTAVNGLWS